jgi:hypothetical protein
MILRRLHRRTLVIGMALSICATLFIAGTPQTASAGTRTMTGTIGCTSGLPPLGFIVNIGGGYLYPPAPGASTRQYTLTIPTDTVGITIDTWCAYTANEYHYGQQWPYGTWQGYSYSVSAGTGAVTADYVCSRYPWLYGQWVRTCSRTSITYG